jgi:hypothetical protein
MKNGSGGNITSEANGKHHPKISCWKNSCRDMSANGKVAAEGKQL